MDIDIKENDILFQSPELLDKLLLDHTTKENIFWATHNYEDLGAAYGYHQRITRDLITGEHGRVIMPRVLKAKSVQDASVKDMAEVFLFSSLGHPNSQIFRSLFADFYAINFLPPKK